MPRPLWSGTIAFGIVSIPIALYTAVHEHAIHFHQISKTDRKRIHYKKVVEGSDDVVNDADIVKGYEVRKGKYVVFEDAELKRIASLKTSVIDITAFVVLSDIDPRYFDQLYYIVPTGHGQKPYALLLESLRETERVGIARLVMHGKEHIVVVRSFGTILGIQTLRFSDEIIDPKRIAGKSLSAPLAGKERALARQLIESMSERFTPSSYTDDFRRRLLAAIARKARGHALALAPDDSAEPADDKVLDLMSALNTSLRARHGRGAAAGARKDVRQARPTPRSHPSRTRKGVRHQVGRHAS